MKKIPLTQGQFAFVDNEDYEELSKYHWSHLKITGHDLSYAARRVKRNGKWNTELMHRCIMNTPKGMQTDHIDGNGLNNQRSNLRVCTAGQNQYNKRKPSGYSSLYKGVFWITARQRWEARIRMYRKEYRLGYYTDEREAAFAYDMKAKELFGEFARLNL